MSKTDLLSKAKKARNDEFYTRLQDIELELNHYREYFKGKVILCNCDDPYESNFFKYFAMNFNSLGLKKLISTCYNGSPIVGNELLLDFGEEAERPAYKVEICEVRDENGDGAIDLADVEYLLQNDRNCRTILKSGDFQSEECIALLKEADIVVTNPPFSLFREYLGQLRDYNKQFIIIGNTNAFSYKITFEMFKYDEIRTGYTNFNKGMFFQVPDSFEKFHHIDDNGKKIARVSTACWYTNLPVKKHNEKLILYKHYTPEEYPHYDNYNAIEVSKYTEIPCDYDGYMGVPITFLDKYNPEQFEILWIACGNTYANAPREILEQVDFNPNMKYGGGLGCTIVNGKPTYSRILIRKKL